MKAIYFLKYGIASPEDVKRKEELRTQGYKVIFSNGNVERGFEDSCNAVYLAGDFPLVKAWAEGKGVAILNNIVKASKAAKVEPEADEEPAKEEPEKPKRRGRPPAQA